MDSTSVQDSDPGFVADLARLVDWSESHQAHFPHLEAILAWGFGQPYQHRVSTNSIVSALNGFTARSDLGKALVFSVALADSELYSEKSERVLRNPFKDWLTSLRSRFHDRAAEWLYRDGHPLALFESGHGYGDEGIALQLSRGDGQRLQCVIPFAGVPELLDGMVKSFRDGGGFKKLDAEARNKLKAVLNSLTEALTP